MSAQGKFVIKLESPMRGHLKCNCQHDASTIAMHQQGEELIKKLIQPILNYNENEWLVITGCHNSQADRLQYKDSKIKYVLYCLFGHDSVHIQAFPIRLFESKSSFNVKNKHRTLSLAGMLKVNRVYQFDIAEVSYHQEALTEKQQKNIARWKMYNAPLSEQL